jgi:hypothetical protein
VFAARWRGPAANSRPRQITLGPRGIFSGRLLYPLAHAVWAFADANRFPATNTQGLTVTAAASIPPRGRQPPTFQAALGWWILTTGPIRDGKFLPATWAVSDPHGVQPEVFDLFKGLRRLSRQGILIWAFTYGRGGPTHVFTPTTWPLRLSTFRLDHSWEGQPAPNVQQRLRWAAVGGWHLDVRVYFGTQHPSANLLRKAQAELDRLRLPPH